MKRTFLAKRNTLLSSASALWGVGALVFVLVVLLARVVAPNVFLHAAAPLFRVANALAARGDSLAQGFADAAALASRNEQLEDENAALANENRILTQKVADISALFSSAGTDVSDGILAGVVARPPESPYDTLVVAAGSRAGVTLGMEAFGVGGAPVGVVSSVLADFSRITLFSAPGMTTLGWVGSGQVPLTIAGTGAGTLSSVAARSAGIMAADTVFVPGPGMLPIGTVARVDSDPSSPSVTLRIQPVQNPFSISWVVMRDTGAAMLVPATSTPL